MNDEGEYADMSRQELIRCLQLDDARLDDYRRTIAMIPECPEHGDQCLPHVRGWIQGTIALSERQAKETANEGNYVGWSRAQLIHSLQCDDIRLVDLSNRMQELEGECSKLRAGPDPQPEQPAKDETPGTHEGDYAATPREQLIRYLKKDDATFLRLWGRIHELEDECVKLHEGREREREAEQPPKAEAPAMDPEHKRLHEAIWKGLGRLEDFIAGQADTLESLGQRLHRLELAKVTQDPAIPSEAARLPAMQLW